MFYPNKISDRSLDKFFNAFNLFGNISIPTIRNNDYWNRGSSKGHANGRIGQKAKAIAKRRRLRDIAYESRRSNR